MCDEAMGSCDVGSVSATRAVCLPEVVAALNRVALRDDAELRSGAYTALRDVVIRLACRFEKGRSSEATALHGGGGSVDTDACPSDGEDEPPLCQFHDPSVGDDESTRTGAPVSRSVALINEQIADCPSSGLLYARRAEAHLKSSDFEEALRDCDTSLTLNASCTLALRVRASLYADWKEDCTNALADLQLHQMIDFDPDIAKEVERLGSRIDEMKQKESERRATPKTPQTPKTPTTPPTPPSPLPRLPQLPNGYGVADMQTLMSDPRILEMAQKMMSGMRAPDPQRPG